MMHEQKCSTEVLVLYMILKTAKNQEKSAANDHIIAVQRERCLNKRGFFMRGHSSAKR